jgi:2-polyprenyl-3-methyl-5-hydroxy-6-metoxy-1,4-benzoquinol methylase
MDFSIRSYKKEFLDRDDIPFDAIKRNMEELNFINAHLGGHLVTIMGLRELLSASKDISVCEIGCGGGDNLLAIKKWCTKKKIKVKLMGIDINASCITLAKTTLDQSNHQLIHADYKSVNFQNDKPDIIFSSLFCHHFTDQEMVFMLGWMMKNSGTGIFINDLHRHPVAYYSIKLLTKIFSRSYLVKNDAPLSVLRGFTKKDWKLLLDEANFENYDLHWRWAFRWLLVIKHLI